ncbi:MAG: hypothetical protein HY075_03700 [Deltaproteobacteria bacterium]|nr:hypothetical protein [Deltaproteobacteria bacterium]
MKMSIGIVVLVSSFFLTGAAWAAEPKITLSCDVISYVTMPGQKAPKEVVEGTFSAVTASSPEESLIVRGAVGRGNAMLARIYVFAPFEWRPATQEYKVSERLAWLNLEIEGQPTVFGGGLVSTKGASAYLSAAYAGGMKAATGDTIHELGVKCRLDQPAVAVSKNEPKIEEAQQPKSIPANCYYSGSTYMFVCDACPQGYEQNGDACERREAKKVGAN